MENAERRPMVDSLHDAAAHAVRDIKAGTEISEAVRMASAEWDVPERVIAGYILQCQRHGLLPVTQQKSQSYRAELQQVGYAIRRQCEGMNGR